MRKLLYIVIAIILLAACVGSGKEREVLDEADSLNRAYIPITSDSLLKEATAYFDSHGTPNERLRAHYLLGCAYRDMGESPRAIETWQDAVNCADTAAADCDYKTLGKAYSQMANLFYSQLLLSEAVDARKKAYHFTLLSKDTLVAIHEYKMMASSYLLQNKNDSAEIILKDAILLYQKHGYLQEELKASTMLMYLYADQPSKNTALKDLIDRYESKCSLFDENHELPPSKRQYFYYKGKYYENINLLDSAEMCYRKIFRPKMSYLSANPMYKGLLSVYQKKHIGDSIAKYATLYCMSIDSSSILKDRELTAQMAANYNYNRYQKQAQENAEKANRRLYIAVVLLSLSILGIITAVFFNLRYRKKRKALEKLQREYEEAQCNYDRTQERLRQLKQELLMMEHNRDIVIEDKKKEIVKLSAQIADYKVRFDNMPDERCEAAMQNDNIVLSFREKAKAKRGNCQPTSSDWSLLKALLQENIPHFYNQVVHNEGLTQQELQTCILCRLGFRTGEIAVLLDTTVQRITNVKISANQNLFGKREASSLSANLKEI